MKNKDLDDLINVSHLNHCSWAEGWTAEALDRLCLITLSGLANPKRVSIEKWSQNWRGSPWWHPPLWVQMSAMKISYRDLNFTYHNHVLCSLLIVPYAEDSVVPQAQAHLPNPIYWVDHKESGCKESKNIKVPVFLLKQRMFRKD